MVEKKSTKSIYFWDGNNDEFYSEEEPIIIYSCKECRIKNEDGNWKLPKALQPSEKQIKYARVIGQTLHISTNHLVTKQQYWAFIHKFSNQFQKYMEEEYSRNFYASGAAYFFNDTDFF
ncbi:MAG: hypothetical protein VZS44_09830 [Bacilli bacterium]|nr:hypothetical protein [Bacilli bacterium]